MRAVLEPVVTKLVMRHNVKDADAARELLTRLKRRMQNITTSYLWTFPLIVYCMDTHTTILLCMPYRVYFGMLPDIPELRDGTPVFGANPNPKVFECLEKRVSVYDARYELLDAVHGAYETMRTRWVTLIQNGVPTYPETDP